MMIVPIDRWYLRYLKKLDKQDLFFASYGSFVHRIINYYYKGVIQEEGLRDYYLREFRNEVMGAAPSVKVFEKYFLDGLNYFNNFSQLPFNLVDTEIKINYKINRMSMVAIIDYLGEAEDGFVIVDHKSRNLKPRSNRPKPTKTDFELNSYLVQLYLYAEAVRQQYGELPKWLCFNCFRTNTLIKEPFDDEAFLHAKSWLKDKVKEISNETEFRPNAEWFKCKYLCDLKDKCEYFDLIMR